MNIFLIKSNLENEEMLHRKSKKNPYIEFPFFLNNHNLTRYSRKQFLPSFKPVLEFVSNKVASSRPLTLLNRESDTDVSCEFC